MGNSHNWYINLMPIVLYVKNPCPKAITTHYIQVLSLMTLALIGAESTIFNNVYEIN